MEDQRKTTEGLLDGDHLCDLEGELQHLKGMACL